MAADQTIIRGHSFKNIAGQTFGYLRAIRVVGKTKHSAALWECLCDKDLGGCGSLAVKVSSQLLAGRTRSCGCLHDQTVKTVNTTHGMRYTAEYRSWNAMQQRCTNPKSKAFPDYGGRGIRVCERWLRSFENFFADMGPKPSTKHTLERMNNDGNYEPDNCIWSTRSAQSRNNRLSRRFTINGQTKCLTAWAEERGIKASIVWQRLGRGWSIERALS